MYVYTAPACLPTCLPACLLACLSLTHICTISHVRTHVFIAQGSPLGRDFGEFVSAARVTVLGLVPSIARTWRSSGCMAGLDWSSIRCFSSTGEASSPDDAHWLASRVPGYRPVIE